MCPVYDFGEIDGVWYLTMPYIAGRALSALIAERPRAPGRGRVFGRAVARAMAVAHQSGVVHRDLKPANILFNKTANQLSPTLVWRTAVRESIRY